MVPGWPGILFEQEDLPLPLFKALHYPTDVTRQRIMYIRADGGASPQFTGLEVTSGRLQDISLNKDGSRSLMACLAPSAGALVDRSFICHRSDEDSLSIILSSCIRSGIRPKRSRTTATVTADRLFLVLSIPFLPGTAAGYSCP
jgi:hypothetical protein